MSLVMTIVPYWQPESQTWAFGGPAGRPLVKRVPEMIGVLSQGIANAKEGFRLLLSEQPFPGWQKKLTWLREETGGNRYACDDPELDGWLCPARLWYFDQAPAEIYVKAEKLRNKNAVQRCLLQAVYEPMP